MWRGAGHPGPAPPDPWPSRVEAFQLACAIHAGQRERDTQKAIEMVGAIMLSKAGGSG